MPKELPDDIEERHRATATEIVDLFMPEDPEEDHDAEIVALFEKMNPVDAAAVAVHCCYELDPDEIAEFLAVLEGTIDAPEAE